LTRQARRTNLTHGETMHEDFANHPHCSAKNLINLALPVVAPLPSFLVAVWVFAELRGDGDGVLSAFVHAHPIVQVNVLFFLNVCVLFWMLSLIQRSTWLIDPYWTILPLLIAYYYGAHPSAVWDPTRATLAMVALWVWSVRLSYNYFRRERWRFGAREDWRFAKKRQETRHFWWYSFFYTYLAQQLMLVGLTLPFYAVFASAAAFDALDALLCGAALVGVGVAHVADTQLARFMADNEARVARGEPRVLILETGLWRYSRHPNYFGEQLFWWAIAGLGVKLGMPWTVAGTVLNTIVLAVVTRMTEARMAARPERAEAFDAYRRTVSVWIPWFRRSTTKDPRSPAT
jgi:steroid 5-alpha reductase family enzyme